ncbi:hypothetical protein [Desulfoferrobacter suflitae]|uniref:hypothetical protein n=1 Tax=Desulfoferrobacter suflitae TaxID=2865782 RepID=UPI0021648563|nr:hypothetical protein [Desulfoferrobacter suflitae]MCK8604379.1 hypothetical protein [Desulfoferrobacter suflitae]
MKEHYETNSFDHSQYAEIRQKNIDCGKNNPCKEPYYKMSARHILDLEGFQSIMDGTSVSEFRGVPFDFLANKIEENFLSELKGSLKGWSMPGDTQLARMHDLLNRLAENALEVEFWLLQISLEKGQYRVWSKEIAHGSHSGLDQENLGEDLAAVCDHSAKLGS